MLLSQLLHSIGPESPRIAEIARLANAAAEEFSVIGRQIQTQEDLEDCMAAFVFRVMTPADAQSSLASTSMEHWWTMARECLRELYPNSKDSDLLWRCQQDVNGGIRDMLTRLCNRLIEKRIYTYVDQCISEFHRSLSRYDILDAADEYLRRYSAIIPASLRNGSSPFRANFPAILRHHREWVRQYHNL